MREVDPTEGVHCVGRKPEQHTKACSARLRARRVRHKDVPNEIPLPPYEKDSS